MWLSVLLWLGFAVMVLIFVAGTIEAWPWVKKFKNNNEDANTP